MRRILSWLDKKLFMLALKIQHWVEEQEPERRKVRHTLSDQLECIRLMSDYWLPEHLSTFQKVEKRLSALFDGYMLEIDIYPKLVKHQLAEIQHAKMPVQGKHLMSGWSPAEDFAGAQPSFVVVVIVNHLSDTLTNTTFHEVAHGVFRVFGLESLWREKATGLEYLGDEWSNKTTPNPGLMSVYASRNPEEAFCEAFAYFCENGTSHDDPKVVKNLELIEAIIQDIQVGKIKPLESQQFVTLTPDE